MAIAVEMAIQRRGKLPLSGTRAFFHFWRHYISEKNDIHTYVLESLFLQCHKVFFVLLCRSCRAFLSFCTSCTERCSIWVEFVLMVCSTLFNQKRGSGTCFVNLSICVFCAAGAQESVQKRCIRKRGWFCTHDFIIVFKQTRGILISSATWRAHFTRYCAMIVHMVVLST